MTLNSTSDDLLCKDVLSCLRLPGKPVLPIFSSPYLSCPPSIFFPSQTFPPRHLPPAYIFHSRVLSLECTPNICLPRSSFKKHLKISLCSPALFRPLSLVPLLVCRLGSSGCVFLSLEVALSVFRQLINSARGRVNVR